MRKKWNKTIKIGKIGTSKGGNSKPESKRMCRIEYPTDQDRGGGKCSPKIHHNPFFPAEPVCALELKMGAFDQEFEEMYTLEPKMFAFWPKKKIL